MGAAAAPGGGCSTTVVAAAAVVVTATSARDVRDAARTGDAQLGGIEWRVGVVVVDADVVVVADSLMMLLLFSEPQHQSRPRTLYHFAQ